jgi:peptide/nickel transport system permease protein
MLSMLLRRLSLGFITVALVSIIIFTGVEFLPGDACTAFLEREAQGKLLENCRRDLDLNRPAIDRYLDWASSAMVGDLGVSVNGQQSIAELVGNRMNNSLLLAFCALLVGVPLAIFLGVIQKLDSRRDVFIR